MKPETGGAKQENPCVNIEKLTGKHRWSCWHSTHKEGYKFFVPICPICGYVDTDRILKELEQKGCILAQSLKEKEPHDQ